MRTLLHLMRENKAEVQKSALMSAELLELACHQLTILHQEVGEEELIKAVAAEVARLRALSRSE